MHETSLFSRSSHLSSRLSHGRLLCQPSGGLWWYIGQPHVNRPHHGAGVSDGLARMPAGSQRSRAGHSAPKRSVGSHLACVQANGGHVPRWASPVVRPEPVRRAPPPSVQVHAGSALWSCSLQSECIDVCLFFFFLVLFLLSLSLSLMACRKVFDFPEVVIWGSLAYPFAFSRRQAVYLHR